MEEKMHTKYINDDGIRVPGVTTILRLLAKPALIHWAWKCGIDAIDYRIRRDKASDIGTCAHHIIAADITSFGADLSEFSKATIDKAENAYLAWMDWCKSFGDYNTIASEIPMVCSSYGGTLDWVIERDGKIILIDFKTSKGIYPEMVYQLSAYKNLWNGQVDNLDKQIEECYILRIGKEDGAFEQRKYTDLNEEFCIFEHLLGVYKMQKQIERRK